VKILSTSANMTLKKRKVHQVFIIRVLPWFVLNEQLML
jgi:hypothetical protein